MLLHLQLWDLYVDFNASHSPFHTGMMVIWKRLSAMDSANLIPKLLQMQLLGVWLDFIANTYAFTRVGDKSALFVGIEVSISDSAEYFLFSGCFDYSL